MCASLWSVGEKFPYLITETGAQAQITELVDQFHGGDCIEC